MRVLSTQIRNSRLISFACFALFVISINDSSKTNPNRELLCCTDTVAPQKGSMHSLKVYLTDLKESRALTVKDIQNARELKIEKTKDGYRIVRFKLNIDKPGNYQGISIKNLGSRFSEELIERLSQVVAGDFVTIQDIDVMSGTGEIITVSPKIYQIE